MVLFHAVHRRARLHLPWLAASACVLAFAAANPALAVQPSRQDGSAAPVRAIEERLRTAVLDVTAMDRSRPLQQDRSRRVVLAGEGGAPALEVHWKPVAPPGDGFNNEPRYVLAAYRFQAMFLDEQDRVAVPVVLRALPLDEYRRHADASGPTVRGTRSVLFLLSYWLHDISLDTVDPFSLRLFDLDSVYARHFANANLFTHLINHRDGNHGNVVVSMDAQNRRVFVLDSDVAFRSRLSDQGDRWSRLHVNRVPASSVARLRAISRAELERELGVVAEFTIADGLLQPAEPGPNLRPDRGLRVEQGRVQFGLTRAEIADLHGRIQRLLDDVDRGRLRTF
jgi:hypothetical protein